MEQAEAMEALAVVAALDQAVPRHGEEEQPQRGQEREESRQLAHLSRRGQLLVPFLEEAAILKTEQHLGAEHQHPRLVERVLDLVLEPGPHFSKVCPRILW